MREIKFRAKVNGVYVYSDSYVNLAFYFDATKGYEQQQYTGLKDKNEKEIYEGDIITVFENVNGITKPWQNIVCFKSGAFCLYDPNCCKVCKDGFGITCTLLEGKYIGDLEIIGNIYENPKLLNND